MNKQAKVYFATEAGRAQRRQAVASVPGKGRFVVIIEYYQCAEDMPMEELELQRLPKLLRLRYHDSIPDAVADLSGDITAIHNLFSGFQRYKAARLLKIFKEISIYDYFENETKIGRFPPSIELLHITLPEEIYSQVSKSHHLASFETAA